MDSAALQKEARSKLTTPARLLELTANRDLKVQLAVAGNPRSPSAALEYLSGHGKFNILKAVAKNPSTPAAVLERLAAHKQATVCAVVAGNPNAPQNALEHLVRHADSKVREAIIGNRNASAKVLEYLGDDPEPAVRAMTVKALWRLRQSDLRSGMQDAVVFELLRQLSSDPDESVRNVYTAERIPVYVFPFGVYESP